MSRILKKYRRARNKRKLSYEFVTVERHSVWGLAYHYTYDDYYAVGYSRRMRTTQERRSAEGLRTDEDARFYNLLARGARNYRNLPNAWDDERIAAREYRKSWKHNSRRSRQWKIDE